MPQVCWVYLDLSIKIAVEGPLHIGTGYDRGLIQRTVVRDAGGNIYIPGSTLKGKVRNVCENLARRSNLNVCGLPRVAEVPETANHKPKRCLVCRVFGAPGGNDPEGRGLSWHDAHLTEEWHRETAIQGRSGAWPVAQTTTRTQVQLSRKRGVAAEDRLYTSEFAASGLEFAGQISGWVNATRCTAETGFYEVNLLLAGLRLVEMLGGGRSRGTGRCRIEYIPPAVTLRVKGQDEPEGYALADLVAAAGSLGLFTEEEGGADGGA